MLAKKTKIFNKVQSSSTRTSTIRDKSLLKFYEKNPLKRAGDHRSLDNDAYIKTNVGRVITCDVCTIEELTVSMNTSDLLSFVATWNSIEHAMFYTVHVQQGDSTYVGPTITYDTTNPLTATIEYPDYDYSDKFIVRAHTPWGIQSSSADVLPCFLAGSIVHMADGTTKWIENVQVNDLIIGAFGEINKVLFLHRPLLGTSQMCCLNGEHHTTTHHPHVSLNKQFYCGEPDKVSTLTYGHTHKVIDEQGNVVDQMLHGLNKERIHTLHTGVELKTITGSTIVHSIEVYSMDENTQLYNLVVDGSHTYHVDGYAVTGWPNEHDFDYDIWKCK
jgi:hypothetical protein